MCCVLQILSGSSSTGSLGAEQAVGEECGSLHLALSAGETHECSVVLHNVSSQPVEELTIALESKMDKDQLHQVREQCFKWSCKIITIPLSFDHHHDWAQHKYPQTYLFPW